MMSTCKNAGMIYIFLPSVALLASLLTFYSGFGLGTLLLPAFALYFSLDISVALTAIVHLLANIFKLALVAKHADREVCVKFGVPAIVAAALGAILLSAIAQHNAPLTINIFSSAVVISPLKAVIGILMLIFALFELSPLASKWSFSKRYLTLGGILSGFFGGLSGHQGAFRSLFLLSLNLSKEAFIATGVVIACLVDLSRLVVYGSTFSWNTLSEHYTILLLTCLAAFLGAYLGQVFLAKTTIKSVRFAVAAMLIVFSLGLMLGLI